jgi:hypothetical protein
MSTVSSSIARTPLVRLVSGELLAARREHGQLRLAALVKALAVDESIRAGGDFGGDLGADVGVSRLDLLDVLLLSTGPWS